MLGWKINAPFITKIGYINQTPEKKGFGPFRQLSDTSAYVG